MIAASPTMPSSVGVELLAKPFTIADVAGALARALG
jgi:hypothetical protein